MRGRVWLVVAPETETRIAIARIVSARLSAVPGLTSLAVIGSTALGTATPESDVDMVGTYDEALDRAEWAAACDEVGRDPDRFAHATAPGAITEALRVDGVPVHVMLGPDEVLADFVRRAPSFSETQREHSRSYGEAIVLHDPKELWPAVKRAALRRLDQ